MLSHVAEIAALLGRLDALASPRTKAELLKCVGLANAYLNYKRHI